MAARTPLTQHETPEPRCLVHIRIETRGDKAVFVATTPHVPQLKAEDEKEHLAVNKLADTVRAYRKPYEAENKPVPWLTATDTKKDPEVKVIHLTGLAPAHPLEPADRAGKTASKSSK